MAKFQRGYRLENIGLDAYTKKSTGEKEIRKVCNFVRMEQSKMTGNWLPALRNAVATVSMFPKRYSRATGELVDDTIYGNIDQYKGDIAPIAIGKLDTTPFNFDTDGADAEPRTSITVSTEFAENDSDDEILDRLVNNAKYQLRGLGVKILVDGAVKATSYTALEYAKAKEDGEARGKKLAARLAELKKAKADKVASAPAEPTAEELAQAELDEALAAERAAFKLANPTAKAAAIKAHMDAFEEQFLEGQVNGAK